MGLDVRIRAPLPVDDGDDSEVFFEANITHNLTRMARAAGIYRHIWQSEGFVFAGDLIPKLTAAIELLQSNTVDFIEFEPRNGWGHRSMLLDFCKNLLTACEKHPLGRYEAS